MTHHRRRTGNVSNPVIAVGANNAVLGFNPKRRFIQIGSQNSSGYYIQFAAAVAVANQGYRITPGQDGISLDYDQVGDVVCQPVSIYNAGTQVPIQIVEGFAADDDL